MSPKSFVLDEALHHYLMEHSSALDEIQRDLIEETAALGGVSGMQVAPEEGATLTLLTALMGARNAVEVGTFTGYSALCIARGLAPGGRLLCCDVSAEWTAVAERYWRRAEVDDRIELVIGPAAETLRSLPPEPHLDLAFIDADKGGYRDYAEQLIPRLRDGGLLVVDNVLWGGRVVGDDPSDASLQSIRSFNDWLVARPELELVMLPISDGITLARRRPRELSAAAD